MVKITIDLPEELVNFIDKKVKEKLFQSREDYIVHAARLLAELYGIGGVSLLNQIISKVLPSKKPKAAPELTEEEAYVLSLFRESTFLYPEELWARALEDSIVRGVSPPKKEELFKAVENLIKRGYLQELKKNGEPIIKILKKVNENEV